MDDIRQIAQRLKGLREIFDIPIEKMAEVCETTVEHYRRIESGEADPGVYRLTRISKQYGIALDVLLYGEEPRMNGYFVTRRGKGLEVDRHNDYKLLFGEHKSQVIDPQDIGKVLPWVHIAIANAKTLFADMYHGIKPEFLQEYLNEFCNRFNRRYFGEDLFDRLVMIAASYRTDFEHRTYRKVA